jgi:hypothetical protein
MFPNSGVSKANSEKVVGGSAVMAQQHIKVRFRKVECRLKIDS